MNSMRKVLCFLMAMMLTAFALPASAASTTKFFTASASALVPNGTTPGIQFTFNNATPPPGVSTINSVSITPPSFVTINCNSITPGTGTPAGNSCVVTNFPGIKTGKSGTFTFTATSNAPSCTAGQWNSAANAGNSFPQGDVFQLSPGANQPTSGVGCDGILGCNDSFTKPASNGIGPNDPGYVSGSRGLFNKDGVTNGTGCVTVFYGFANDILGGPGHNKGHLAWDTASQPNAAFTFTMNFQLRSVATGWTDVKHPKVAWLNQDGSPATTVGTPLFVPGLACLGTNPPMNLPAPYGKLAADIAMAAGNITIDTSTGVVPVPTSGPFPLVIGTERMTATFGSVSGTTTTLSVTRGEGGTGPAVGHLANAPVMSTPMPIIPSTSDFPPLGYPNLYLPGTQAHMCVQDYGWVSDGGLDASGNAQVYDFATFIDQGDGWGSE